MFDVIERQDQRVVQEDQLYDEGYAGPDQLVQEWGQPAEVGITVG
jgi:hypothetical protein